MEIIIAVIIAAAFFAAAVKKIHDIKNGGCGCGCSACKRNGRCSK